MVAFATKIPQISSPGCMLFTDNILTPLSAKYTILFLHILTHYQVVANFNSTGQWIVHL